VESDGGVLVIKRIHAAFVLQADDSVRSIVERVHGVYADKCPIYRSIRTGIEITSSYALKPIEDSPPMAAP
jgi:uncharacterized OsmC-like protein